MSESACHFHRKLFVAPSPFFFFFLNIAVWEVKFTAFIITTQIAELLFLSARRHKNFPWGVNYGTAGFFHLSSFSTILSVKIFTIFLSYAPNLFLFFFSPQFPSSLHEAKGSTIFNLIKVKYIFLLLSFQPASLPIHHLSMFNLRTSLLKIANVFSSISGLFQPFLKGLFSPTWCWVCVYIVYLHIHFSA